MKRKGQCEDKVDRSRGGVVHHACGCCSGHLTPGALGRRQFVKGMAMTAAGAALARLELFDLASSACGELSKPAGGPRVRVVYVRPQEEPIVSWPGGNCDVPAQQALFTRTLRAAADKLGVRLEVRDEPIKSEAEVAKLLAELKQSPPDGLIVGAMSLFLWKPVMEIVEKRGDIPTVIHSHVSGFTGHIAACGRKTPKTFMAATQKVEWLATAVRMFHTNWRIKNTRILQLSGPGADVTLAPWGTLVHPIAKARFEEFLKQVETSEEVRAIADHYAKGAERILEPTKAEILTAAKNYIALRRLMEAEKCHGVTVACLGWKDPVCMAFSKLLDEGIPGVCECDHNAVVGELLAIHLLNRPGFIQDPSPNTVDNTFIGAHCTSPTRLEGYDSTERAAYWLRSYHTKTGCSMEVMWPVGKPVTVLQAMARTPLLLVGTGRVRSNIAQPPSGCCRTAVELEMDKTEDTRDVKGFHQLFLLGNHARTVAAYGRLFDIKVESIS